MTKKTKATALLKRVLMSRLLAIVALIGICYGLFSFAVAAVTVVDVQDGENVLTVITTRKNPTEIIEQAGIEVRPKDEIDLTGFQKEDGSVIKINRNYHLTIINGDQEQSFDFVGETVEEALHYAGFTVEENDIVLPAPDVKLFDNMHISIDKIRYADRTETEPIIFDVEKTESKDVYQGKTKTTREGEDGEKQLTYSDKYVNDVLTDSVLVSEVVTREPVSKQVLVGTKERPVAQTATAPSNITLKTGNKISELTEPDWLKLDENGLPVEYSHVIEGKATAYSPKDGTVTATGKRAMPGYVAVNPNQIPYGTKMYIVSTDGKYVYGYAIAADTGGFAKSGSAVADLFFNTEEACFQFGRRNIRIYVLG